MKKFFLCSLICLFFFLSSCKASLYEYSSSASLDELDEYILIDLRGEVLYPSVYKVKKGTLLNDLLNMAGGTSKKADLSNFSLVSELSANQKIIIPSVITKTGDNKLININEASLDELKTLPSIGESKAKAILEYKALNGNFKTKEEI